MTEWIASSCVLIATVAFLRWALKGKLSLRLQYGLWAIVLVRLLLPANLYTGSFNVSTLIREASRQEAFQTLAQTLDTPEIDYEEAYEVVVTELENNGVDTEALSQAEKATLNILVQERLTQSTPAYRLGDALVHIWVAGIAFLALCLLTANIHFGLQLRKNRTPREAAGCPVRVYISERVETPCLFGVFQPKIYVTPQEAADPNVLQYVLAHETTHYRHADHLWSLLRCVCLALHWYNPLVWLAAVLSKRDAELACDEATIHRLGEECRIAYGHTLLDMTRITQSARGILLTSTTMVSGKKSLTERIRLIAKKPKMAAWALVLVVLIATITVGCTFTGAQTEHPAHTAPGITEPSDTHPTESHPTEDPAPSVSEPVETKPATPQPTDPPPTVPQLFTLPQDSASVVTITGQFGLADLIKTHDAGVIGWESQYNHCDFKYKVPHITPFSNDAIRIQQEINALFEQQRVDTAAELSGGYDNSVIALTYEAYYSRGILSIILTQAWSWESIDYFVYNLDVQTGNRLDNAGVLEKLDISQADYVSAATQVAGNRYLEKNGPVDESYDSGFSSTQLESTVSRKNIDGAQLYADSNGRLWMAVNIYSIAGANYYTELLEVFP